MTALNMKSELLMESRLRAESRQPLQRRRIAKTASACAVLENGECDPDLNLAIQESLKLARDNELKQQQASAALSVSNYDEDEENEPIATSPISKTDKACTKKQPESKTDQPQSVDEENPSSSTQIKGLLMLHLDLIQHQQELITSKDKEITNLKDDKEALKCRLERMERRMAILKQKDDVLEVTHHSRTSTSDSPAGLHCVERSQKRKSSFEPFNLNKKFANDTGRVPRTLNHATNGAKSSIVRNEPSNQGLRISRRKGKSSEFIDNSETEENLRRQEFLQKRSKIHEEHSILRTEDLTPVLQYTPLFEDDDETIHERLRAGNEKQAEVEIPTWRYRTVPNCYTLEGTENLEDEVFIKRHQKPEYEEKRRKRWDLQRLREQRMYEHLKEKKEKVSDFVGPCRSKDNHTVSFYPSIEDITHIEVCERIPVSAFGCPIPFIKPSEFELPWEHQAKRSQEKQNEKSTPKTNNRCYSRRR